MPHYPTQYHVGAHPRGHLHHLVIRVRSPSGYLPASACLEINKANSLFRLSEAIRMGLVGPGAQPNDRAQILFQLVEIVGGSGQHSTDFALGFLLADDFTMAKYQSPGDAEIDVVLGKELADLKQVKSVKPFQTNSYLITIDPDFCRDFEPPTGRVLSGV